jgi:hypothetical protein
MNHQPVTNVAHFYPTRGEIVRDQASVTAPPEGFGAHEHQRRFQGQRRDQRPMKLRCLHVVGIASKSIQAPTRVDRIGGRVATAAEVDKMRVFDARRAKGRSQGIAAELGMATRAGEAADVDQCRDAVRRQER